MSAAGWVCTFIVGVWASGSLFVHFRCLYWEKRAVLSQERLAQAKDNLAEAYHRNSNIRALCALLERDR